MVTVKTIRIIDLCGSLKEKNEQLQRFFKEREEYLIARYHNHSTEPEYKNPAGAQDEHAVKKLV